jgi:hypothetical protein
VAIAEQRSTATPLSAPISMSLPASAQTKIVAQTAGRARSPRAFEPLGLAEPEPLVLLQPNHPFAADTPPLLAQILMNPRAATAALAHVERVRIGDQDT